MSSLKLCHLLEELKTTDATLTKNAGDVSLFLKTLPLQLSDEQDIALFNACLIHYENIATHSNFWDTIDTPNKDSTDEEIATIFKTINANLGDELTNESFKKRAESCAWISIHFTQILGLFKKLPDSQNKDEIVANKLITPVQRLPRLTLFSKEWLRECPENLDIQSINRKFLRMVSTLNQLLKAAEHEALYNNVNNSIFDKLFGTVHVSKIDDQLIGNSIGNSLEFSVISADALQLSLVEDITVEVDDTFYANLEQFNNNIEQYQLDHSISDLPPVLDEFIAFINYQNAADDPTIPKYDPPVFTNSMIMIGLDENIPVYLEPTTEEQNQIIETNSSEKTSVEKANKKRRARHITVHIHSESDSESYSDEESDNNNNNNNNNNIEQAPKNDDVVVENKKRKSVSKVKENEDVFEGEKTFFIVSYIIGILVFGAVGLALSVPLGPIGMIAGTAIGIGFGFGFIGAVEGILTHNTTLFSVLFTTGAAITGTGIGAMLGTLFFPGVGTIIGAAIGAAIGAGIGAGVGFSVAGIVTLFTENKFAGTVLLGAGTTTLGAGVGAILGTIFIPIPGIGTAIGAGIGAGAGLLATAIPAAITFLSIYIKEKLDSNDNNNEPTHDDLVTSDDDMDKAWNSYPTMKQKLGISDDAQSIKKGLDESGEESTIENDQPYHTYASDLLQKQVDANEKVLDQSTTATTTTKSL